MNSGLRLAGCGAVAAIMMLAFGAQAQPPKKPACKAFKEESACKTTDCAWVAAVMDSSGKKEKKKGYCRAMPKPKEKK